MFMNKGVNVKLSVGDISDTGKKILAWDYEQPRHKKYKMECMKCGFIQQTSIKSFNNTCKHCGNSETRYTTKEKQLWNRYKSRANHSKIPFSISVEEFSVICGQECFYCGIEPSQIINLKRFTNNVLIYNGVDRKEDSLGYVPGNCVACCWKCNQAKKNYGLSEFKNMVKIWSNRMENWK
jgi:hypothetical protein